MGVPIKCLRVFDGDTVREKVFGIFFFFYMTVSGDLDVTGLGGRSNKIARFRNKKPDPNCRQLPLANNNVEIKIAICLFAENI